MPIYEYKCLECGSHIEKRQKISDEPLKVCDECGGALEKQWSLSGFQFKGAGWYVTDYANKKTEKPSESGETKTEKTSQAKSTESKETASKKTSENNSSSKKDSVSKND